jgi:hypothetical protein
VNQVYTGITTYSSQINVAGGYDNEVAWNTGTDTINMMNGFYSLNNWPTYDIGDAAGCPQSGRANCVSGGHVWTIDQRYQAAWGLACAYSDPQIYTTDGSQAGEWGNIARYAAHQYGVTIQFSGVLTQYQACQHRTCSPGTNNTPSQGYTQFYNQLLQETDTAMSPRWSEDIVWEEDICPAAG